MVFAGIYPVDSSDYEAAARRDREAASSTTRRSRTSRRPRSRSASASAAASSACCTSRSRRSASSASSGSSLITTAPTVVYEVQLTDGTSIEIDSPAKLPDPVRVESIAEPYVDRHHPRADRVPRRRARAVRGEARHADASFASRRPARAIDRLRDAAGRDRLRLLRPPEVDVARLRVARLRAARTSASRRWSSSTC